MHLFSHAELTRRASLTKPLRGTTNLYALDENRRRREQSFLIRPDGVIVVHYGYWNRPEKKTLYPMINIYPDETMEFCVSPVGQYFHTWLNKLLNQGRIHYVMSYKSRFGGVVCQVSDGSQNYMYPVYDGIRISLTTGLPVEQHVLHYRTLRRAEAHQIKQMYDENMTVAKTFLCAMDDTTGDYSHLQGAMRDIYISNGGDPRFPWQIDDEIEKQRASKFDLYANLMNLAKELLPVAPFESFVFQLISVQFSILGALKHPSGSYLRGTLNNYVFSHNQSKSYLQLFEFVRTKMLKKHLLLQYPECFEYVAVKPENFAPYKSSKWGIEISVNGQFVNQYK